MDLSKRCLASCGSGPKKPYIHYTIRTQHEKSSISKYLHKIFSPILNIFLYFFTILLFMSFFFRLFFQAAQRRDTTGSRQRLPTKERYRYYTKKWISHNFVPINSMIELNVRLSLISVLRPGLTCLVEPDPLELVGRCRKGQHFV